jgi:hypothetical protein
MSRQLTDNLFDQAAVTGWLKRHKHGDLGLLGEDN